MKVKYFTLIEHNFLYISQSGSIEYSDGNIGILEKDFNDIESYIYKNSSESSQFLVPGFSSKYGCRILKAKQYVGVLETKSGLSIEILPKITNIDNIAENKFIFLNMLRTLKNSPFKHFNMVNLNYNKMNILEIFITMFCKELAFIIKRGIKQDYISQTNNSKFLKGHFEITKHFKINLINK